MKRTREEELSEFHYVFMPMHVRNKRRRKESDDDDFMKQYLNFALCNAKGDRTPKPILTSQKPTFSNPPSRYTKGTAPIERLPHDILHDIFKLTDWNVSLPRASHVIGASLSAEHTYIQFCRDMLCFKVVPTPSAEPDPLLRKRMPEKGYHSYPSIRLRSEQITSEYITKQVNLALDSRWMSYTFITSLRHRLKTGQNPEMGRHFMIQAHHICMETPKCPPIRPTSRTPSGRSHRGRPVLKPPVPSQSLQILDVCLDKYDVPPKLLQFPRKQYQPELLKLYFELGSRINVNPNELIGEIADESWRRAAVAGDYPLLWVLLGPGGMRPSERMRQEMLEMTGCCRDIIEFLSALRKEYIANPQYRDWSKYWQRDWLDDHAEITAKLRWRYGKDWKDKLAAELEGNKMYV